MKRSGDAKHGSKSVGSNSPDLNEDLPGSSGGDEIFRLIADNTYDWESWVDQDGKLRWVNPSVERLTGYSRDECLAMDDYPLPIVAPEDRERMRRLFEQESGNDVEFRALRKDGSTAWFSACWQPLLDGAGNSFGYRTSKRDISERKHAEEALRKAEVAIKKKLEVILSPDEEIGELELADVIDADVFQSLMHQFYEVTGVGIGILDEKGRVLVGTGWQDICTKFHRVNPDTLKNCIESDLELSRGVEPGHFKLYHCKNKMWDMATPIVVAGRRLGNIYLGQFFFEDEEVDYNSFREQARKYDFDERGYMDALDRVPRWSREKVDAVMSFYSRLAQMISTASYASIKLAKLLSERERLLSSVHESEERFRLLMDAVPNISVQGYDVDGIVFYWNKASERVYGYSVDEAVGKNLGELIIPAEVQPRFREALEVGRHVTSSGEFMPSGELKLLRKDRSFVPVYSVHIAVCQKDLAPKLFCVDVDLTESKRAQEALSESEKRLRSIYDTATDGILIADAETKRIMDGNRAICEMLGCSREELLEMDITDIHPEQELPYVLGQFERQVKYGGIAHDIQVKRKDGAVFVCEINSSKAELFGRKCLIGIFRDMGDRRRMEEALRERERTLSTLMGNLPGFAYRCLNDAKWTMKFMSDGILALSGYSPHEFVESEGLSFGDVIHPDDRNMVWGEVQEALEASRSYQIEYRIVTKSGDERWVWERGLGVERMGDGTWVLEGFITDITERRRVEAALRASEERFRSLVTLLPQTVYEADVNGRITFVNDSAVEIFGYTKAEFEGMSIADLLSEEDAPKAMESVFRVLAGEKVGASEYLVKRKNGETAAVMVQSDAVRGDDGRVLGMRGIVIDITESKRAGEALRLEHDQLLSVFDSIGEAIYVTDVDTYEVLYANKYLRELIGHDPLGKKCFVEFQGLEEPCAFCSNPIIKKLAGRPYRWEFHNPQLDRDYVLFDRLIKWPDGRDVRFEMAIDVTERKIAEDALRASEERYRNLFESAGDAIFIIEADSGKIVDANGRAATLSGLSVGDLVGKRHCDLYPEQERELLCSIFDEPTGGGREFTRLAHVEHVDGYEVPVQISARYLHMKDADVYLAIFRDITELKDIERAMKDDEGGLASLVSERTMELGRALKQLDDARRLADIGTLAATVAHELRNPLGVISTALYNIRSKNDNRELDRHILNIEKKVVESDRIIRNLLSYTKIKMPVLSEAKLSEILENALEHIAAKYVDLNATLEKQYTCPTEASMRLDVDQIGELVTNLIDNAYQALAEAKGERWLIVGCGRCEGNGHIWVEDSGEGMSDGQVKRAFEPFYSSRVHGIGLGLALCRQIVDLHGGKIEVKSEKGRGTRVDVYLPIR